MLNGPGGCLGIGPRNHALSFPLGKLSDGLSINFTHPFLIEGWFEMRHKDNFVRPVRRVLEPSSFPPIQPLFRVRPENWAGWLRCRGHRRIRLTKDEFSNRDSDTVPPIRFDEIQLLSNALRDFFCRALALRQ